MSGIRCMQINKKLIADKKINEWYATFRISAFALIRALPRVRDRSLSKSKKQAPSLKKRPLPLPLTFLNSPDITLKVHHRYK